MRRLRAGARGLFALASVWFLISLAHVPLWADGRFEHHAPEAPALATVRTIHHLSVEEAARSYPVHVTGVVTALSGFGRSFFVQDATGGITVDRTDELDVHVGDRVDIVGVTSAGYFAPTIISSKVVILGSAPPPPAPPMTYADLVGGAQDSQWVEVHGVVHSARMGKIFDKDTLILGLDVGGTLVKVLLQDYAGIDYPHLIDATVRVRGVATTEFNDRRQFLGVNLFVPLRKDFDLVQPAGADPFAGPALRVRNAFQFGQAAHRVKVAGAVTWQLPGHSIYIQDGEDGIQIETASTDVLALGTPIEVVGFPAMGEYSPVLKGAIFRVTGPPVPVKPLSISAADVISRDSYFNRAKHDGQLVEIKGKVIESHFEGTVRTLILGEDGQVFEAILADPGGRPKDGLANGSIVRLEGICAVVADAEHTPISFRILLRSPHDMALLQTAPWWSSTHALWVLGLLSGAMVMVVLWGMILRTRVESQTKTIRESEERFRDLAQRDVLTGLPNRLLLEERIAACLLRCKESRGKAAVLTIDIDRFKHINDTYGHAAGDECLRVVASRLRNATPETDTIARTGGEEFTLVAAGLKDHEDMERITNRVLDLFRDPVVLGELEIGVTVSVGCAIYPDDGVERAELLKRSDQALYEAKRTGRNRVVFATDELSAQFDRASTIELAVRESLRAGTFTLVYQPVYDAAGTIHRLEALLRTSDELLSALGPAVYVPVAESCGLVLPLGRWVLQAVCRHIAAWRAAGLAVCPISLNLSASQLLQSGFSEDVLQILESHDLHPSVLEFELTEMAAMTDFDTVAEKAVRLARAGVTFAIDDFGSGSSSLARLHRLPLTALKIDRAFVQKIEDSDGTYTLMEAAIQMAHSLKLRAVAKGVERPEQLALLRALGCELFQGFLLARPMLPSAITKILAPSGAPALSAAS